MTSCSSTRMLLLRPWYFTNSLSGNKAQLVERILKHADGSVASTFDEDNDGDDENMPSSSHDDTSSDSEEESTEYEGFSSGDDYVDYVERSFQK